MLEFQDVNCFSLIPHRHQPKFSSFFLEKKSTKLLLNVAYQLQTEEKRLGFIGAGYIKGTAHRILLKVIYGVFTIFTVSSSWKFRGWNIIY